MTSSWTWIVDTGEWSQVNRALNRYFRRKLPGHDHEDLAGDVWLAAARSYRGRGSLHSFVFTVALEKIAEPYREALRLSLEGRSNLQIAAELGIPYNTVRSRLSRGRARVIDALRDELEPRRAGVLVSTEHGLRLAPDRC